MESEKQTNGGGSGTASDNTQVPTTDKAGRKTGGEQTFASTGNTFCVSPQLVPVIIVNTEKHNENYSINICPQKV